MNQTDYRNGERQMERRWIVSKIFINLAAIMFFASMAFANTVSLPLSNGGTFSYNITTTQKQCFILHSTFNYEVDNYSNFAYSNNGVTTSFSGGLTLTVNSPAKPPCPNNSPDNTITFPLGNPDFGSGVNFTPAPSCCNFGQASLVTLPSALVYPKFQVQSIIYAAPGNRSSNGFTNSTTDGTTTSVGSSLQMGDSVTFSITGGFLGIGSTLSWTYAHSNTNGNSTAVTSTMTQATGVANASGGSANAINHSQDLFVIWLNPAVDVVEVQGNKGIYAVGTQLLPNGQPETQDQVEVFAQSMMANAQGVSTVPVAILQPQIVNGETLPGLANVCANLISGFPNTCTLANQCGCVPSDFAPILAHDPLLNFGPTDNPLNADTSGAAACANPGPSNSCRYVPVFVAPGSTTQVTELLAGPQQVGGNIPVNSFTQTDANQTTQTFSESESNTVASTVQRMIGAFGVGFGLATSTQWTWTDSESTGAINGTANSMAVTLSSSTVGCNQDVNIFEDTVFHTFVFQQPAGNTSCP